MLIMDHFFERNLPEVIDLTSDDENIGGSNCQKGCHSISRNSSSGISYDSSTKGITSFGFQGIAGTAASGGDIGSRLCGNLTSENSSMQGCNFSHPQVCSSPSFLTMLDFRKMDPPSDSSFAMHYDNMLPWLKQQAEQLSPQIDEAVMDFSYTNSPKLYSSTGTSFQCLQLEREVQVPSFPPYKHKMESAVRKAYVPPQSESNFNGSIQTNDCFIPDQLPLFYNQSGYRENMSPACHPPRMNQERNPELVSTTDFHPLEAGTPFIETSYNLPPPTCIKSGYASVSHKFQTGTPEISGPIVDRTYSPEGLYPACPGKNTFARKGTMSRRMDTKVFGSSSTEIATKSYEDKRASSEGIVIESGDKPVRVKRPNNSEEPATSDIRLLKDDNPTTVTTYLPPLKRMKLEKTTYSHSQTETSEKSPLSVYQSHSPKVLYNVSPQMAAFAQNGTDSRKMDTKAIAISSKENHPKVYMTKDEICEEGTKAECGDISMNSFDTVGQCKEEEQVQVEFYKHEMEVDVKPVFESSNGHFLGTKLQRQKIIGLCLVDSFSSEEVREHLRSLRQSDVKENGGIYQCTGNLIDTSTTCTLCGMTELHLDHPPKFCGSCSKSISPKKGTVYYVVGDAYITTFVGAADYVFCRECYKASVDSIMLGRMAVLKTHLEKKTDSDIPPVSEPWVQCCSCGTWQHQICAMFNEVLNKDKHGNLPHTCPNCHVQEMEAGICKPLPASKVHSAKNLPATKLSNHLEKWLFTRLEKERQERANTLGKNVEEVPGADDLVVREVSSIDQKLIVNKNFRKIFQEGEYPAEFPYNSKAILLFQKIEGADVCLFAMYVQEYGSECEVPNQRHICISYIDSVKYFRPDIKAVTGEALRTFVYHEILIGYLGYCKSRGFISCYIWSCPPADHDDYILYRHPKTQKIPKSESLRGWYEKVIQKAENESIVVEHTNLYNHYIKPPGICKAKVSASRLPYFDGDYWPGEAEKLLQEDVGNTHQKKETTTAKSRILRNAKRDSSSENPEDVVLMHQLEEKIRAGKRNFIVAHLQHTCKHCYQHIMSGSRWVCNKRKSFHLCDRCHSAERTDRHLREKYSYAKVEVESVRTDTNNEDVIIRSAHFDTRMMFLSLCKSNHYQFDTLRRAKHSTMMILYHLHNTMSDHNLILYRGYQRQQDFWRAMLDLLAHASKCVAPSCTYLNCRVLKRLFRHGKTCKARVRKGKGCKSCMKMWVILELHAMVCKESECSVPRCRDLKVYLRKDPG